MTTRESASNRELVISDNEVEVAFHAARYGLGSWLKGEEEAQRAIDVANRMKSWLADRRSGAQGAELVFIGAEADLVLGNLWAAHEDSDNARRAEATAVLESLYGDSVTFMAIGRTAVQVPPQAGRAVQAG